MTMLRVSAALLLGVLGSSVAAETPLEIKLDDGAFHVSSRFFAVECSAAQPQFLGLRVDSLGKGTFKPSALRPPPAPERETVAKVVDGQLQYRAKGLDAKAPARWAFAFDERSIRMITQWSAADAPEPLVLDFDLRGNHATLLGLVKADQTVRLPAVLHLPDCGSLRVTASDPAISLPYDARRSVGPYARITFPPATEQHPRVEYRCEVTAIYPQLKSITGDARFDGFRRNWLNIFQVNPRLGAVANNSASDICASCAYEYADVALHSPALAEDLRPLDLIGQLLEFYTSGKPGYGFVGWLPFDLDFGPGFPEQHKNDPVFLDAYPNLLIAATDYALGTQDNAWLERNYPQVRGWAEALLALDHDGNGLVEYGMSGDSGSWSPSLSTRPANWWDTIGFGHEDAYSNALAYRGLRGMEQLAGRLKKESDVARYRQAAERLRAVYTRTFYNPATGVLAGWKSADGQLHDYYFLFVNGIAIHYGLVPRARAEAIIDKLLAKLKAVGYTRFELGLPGNLIPVARADYVDLNPRFGGGAKEDNSDGFQIYENGGATACHAFHFLAALYDLGRREEADRILLPMLAAFERGDFQGMGANGMSNDWKAWDGTPWGYEGFLTDNYYALLAVVARDGSLKPAPIPYGPPE